MEQITESDSELSFFMPVFSDGMERDPCPDCEQGKAHGRSSEKGRGELSGVPLHAGQICTRTEMRREKE